MTKNYTIKDIAALAGVSKGTVDRVLHKRGKVSEAALKKVNEVLSQIDYRPNPIAKTLKSNKIYRLVLLLPNIKEDSFWYPCLLAVEDFKDKYQNFGISIETENYNSNDTSSFSKVSEKVILTKPDGILMAPIFQKEAIEIAILCKKEKIVLSTFNNTIKSYNSVNFIDTVNFIGQDLFQSGRIAAKLFDTIVSEGKILIAHIDYDSMNSTHLQAKELGFRSYFNDQEKSRISIDTLNINYKKDQSFEDLEKYYAKNSDVKGIFITTSKTYVGALFNKSKKNSLKIIGYDLISENIKFLKSGQIDYLLHQNPLQQTFLGLSLLAEHFLFQNTLPKQTLLPIDIINVENHQPYLHRQNAK